MNTRFRVAGAALVALAVLAAVSCTPAATTYSAAQVAEAAMSLKALVPAIEAGLSLAKPDSPTERALTPSTTTVPDWPYGTDTPAQVYISAGGTTGTVRLPATGYYSMSSGDQIYFTLTPESTLGLTYYRMVLYTYPAFDMTVAYSVEEYIVNAAGSESWAWGNLDLSKARDKWVSLKTVYTDGTTATRTLQWSSGTAGQYYPAFSVVTPDPATVSTFDGYRYDEVTAAPPTAVAMTANYSSSVTEQGTGKGTVTDSRQYYTETTPTQHSGMTTVIRDKKRKWSTDTYIVTRMEEDTSAGTKTIRSVADLGPGTSYYVDKVDIAKTADGRVTYTSTHDVYGTAMPRGGNPNAADYVFVDLAEDAPRRGTFTGTMEETQGTQKVIHNVKVARDSRNQLAVSISLNKSSLRTAIDDLSLPMTQIDISALSIPLPTVNGTFEGFYEAGSLFGRVTIGDTVYDVVVSDQGVAVDDTLY